MVRVLRGHTAEVSCATLMPYGGSLISGGDDRTLRIWTIDGQTTSILKGHGARITAVAVSGTGRVISISADGIASMDKGSQLAIGGAGLEASGRSECNFQP